VSDLERPLLPTIHPLDALTLRIAPFLGDGQRELRIPTAGGEWPIAYRTRDRHHEVKAPDGVRVTLDVLGPSPPAIALRS
jgi:hypothetical protein